jgi:hypothetical protein
MNYRHTEGAQSRPRCEMVLGGHPRSPASLPPVKTRGTHPRGGWVGPYLSYTVLPFPISQPAYTSSININFERERSSRTMVPIY